jgi:23S rRNA pseudouridine2604 synthase
VILVSGLLHTGKHRHIQNPGFTPNDKKPARKDKAKKPETKEGKLQTGKTTEKRRKREHAAQKSTPTRQGKNARPEKNTGKEKPR